VQSDKELLVSEGHLALGDAYFYGLGVPMDRSKAAAHYESAPPMPGTMLYDAIARKQCAFSLGHAFQFGLGVPQDFNLAKRCVVV
jgi:TPR repeat protein